MKYRPIIFNEEMVRAIIDGRKTQTRRPFKLPKNCYWLNETEGLFGLKDKGCWDVSELPCPFGAVGDRLYVRETFREIFDYCDHPEMPGFPTQRWHFAYQYKSDMSTSNSEFSEEDGVLTPWRPSIHMPREASRITLEITDVRMERLQDISEEDAIAEGLKSVTKDGETWKWGIPDSDGLPGSDNHGWGWQRWKRDPRAAFFSLWDDCYGAGSHAKSTWVWAITFKRV